MSVLRMLLAVAPVVLMAAGCGSESTDVQRLHVEVHSTRPHDTRAFTQGLEVSDGRLLEGTGLAGRSELRSTDLASGVELARVALPAPLFGEGITATDNQVWQLTWRDGVAIERDPITLAQRRRVSYDGEGWGLCAQPDRLVMSDGTDTLTFRDRSTFAVIGSVDVGGVGDAQLNELECTDDGAVYANAFRTNTILRIDPQAGRVTGRIDTGDLLDRPEVTQDQRDRADVLNGIAELPGTDRFLVTGKFWPVTFEVRFVEMFVGDLGQN